MLRKGQSLDEAAILDALRGVVDPDLRRDVVSLGFVKDLRIEGGKVSFRLELTTPACPIKEELRLQCVERVRGVPGVTDTHVELTARVRSANSTVSLEGVRNIVAVASGKGGVGKSTLAINLAVALRESGASVGLLDADVYGPSMAMMFGIQDSPMLSPERKIIPLEGHGVKVISMAFLSGADRPVIWRGPMVHNLLQQFIRNVLWGDLDYLVVDLPPGTGDAQLSLSQVISISGAIIVTTPQDVSLLDARKGLLMFQQLRVPVLGIVENMSYFICPHCSGRTEIFRHGGGRTASAELRVPFLGEVPLDALVAVGGDEGRPIVLSHPGSPVAEAYRAVAGRVAAQLSKLAEEGRTADVPVMPGPMEWK